MNQEKQIVVFIIPTLQGGGAERVVIKLCQGLQKQIRAECHILCFHDKKDYICPNNIFYHQITLPQKTWYGYREKCAQTIDKYILEHIGNPQIVFCNITETVKCMKYSHLNVYNILHCPPSIEYLGNWKGIKRLLRKKRVEHDYSFHPSICVSKGCYEDFKRNFKIKQKIYTIYNPIDTEGIKKEAVSSLEMKNKIQQLGPYIIHVGSFKEAKDHETLIRAYAFSEIKEKLLLLGVPSGKQIYYMRAKQLVKDLNLTQRVVFMGFLPNPFPYIQQAKLFVFSSRYEGFGMALAEAIALNVPIVSTDCRVGPKEIVGEKYSYVLSPVGDYVALGKNIRKALLNPTLYQVPLNEAFTIQAVSKEYAKLIKER